MFSEILACGTGATLVPIKSITRKHKSTSAKFIYQNGGTELGPCAKLLGGLLDDLYKGKTDDKFGWLFQVKEPDLKVSSGVAQINGNGKAH